YTNRQLPVDESCVKRRWRRTRAISAPDLAAVDLGDRHHRRPRRDAGLEVRPARRRAVEGRVLVLARVLDRDEQRAAVGRETGPAGLGTLRHAEELLRQRATGTRRV